jgi:hypothetical protein
MALEINPVDALLWAIVIFIAGFIGYFGKYLSKLILGRIHKSGPEGKKESSAGRNKTKEEMEYDLEKKRLKLEKKRIKAEKKAAKG